jgi:hypothetical protein
MGNSSFNFVNMVIECLNKLHGLYKSGFTHVDDILHPQTSSNPEDSRSLLSLHKVKGTPPYKKLNRLVDHLQPHQRCQILALIWIGRGEFSADQWELAINKAKEFKQHNITDYMISLAEVSSFLKNGIKLYHAKHP